MCLFLGVWLFMGNIICICEIMKGERKIFNGHIYFDHVRYSMVLDPVWHIR